MASVGENIVNGIDSLNVKVGTSPGENFNNGLSPEQASFFRQQSINMWDAIAEPIVNSSSEDYRQVKLYDGSLKRSDNSLNHIDHFIPMIQFEETDDPDYKTVYERNKIEVTQVPEYDEPDPGPPIIDNIRKGYRVIIKDPLVGSEEDCIIRYSILALDKNDANDLPDDYEHITPGRNYIINQQVGEFQIYFENKGAYYFKYGIWNGDINVDFSPRAIPFSEVVTF